MMTLFSWNAIKGSSSFLVVIDAWQALSTHSGPYQALNPICTKQNHGNSESESDKNKLRLLLLLLRLL